MARKRTSIIWTKSKENMQDLLDECSSFVEVLGRLGLSKHSGNHRTLNERVKKDNLNIQILIQNRKIKISNIGKKKKIPSNQIFIENSREICHVVHTEFVWVCQFHWFRPLLHYL